MSVSKRIWLAILFALVAAALLMLYGCAKHPNNYPNGERPTPYHSHVSDMESDPVVKGPTYDKGPSHPTFWEWVFYQLGIK